MDQNPPEPVLSAEACRAARGILRWSIADLVHSAYVSPNSVQKVESGERVRRETAERIVHAFEQQGLELLPRGAQRRH
jgi:predicted transcriptional regulator